MAGVTPIIDQHHAVMGLLGPRFVQLRIVQGDRILVATRAMKNARLEKEMRGELAGTAVAFLKGLPNEPPEVDDTMIASLASIADVVTRARSPVVRDGYRRELDYAPEPEAPSRFARQLYALLQGVTLVNGHTAADDQDLNRIARVARDCIPGMRWTVLKALSDAVASVKTSAISAGVQYATTSIRRTLEDVQALGLVTCTKGGEGHADAWSLVDTWRETLTRLATVSEKSGDPSYTQTEEEDSQAEVEWSR